MLWKRVPKPPGSPRLAEGLLELGTGCTEGEVPRAPVGGEGVLQHGQVQIRFLEVGPSSPASRGVSPRWLTHIQTWRDPK
jgi:hypothetical protein